MRALGRTGVLALAVVVAALAIVAGAFAAVGTLTWQQCIGDNTNVAGCAAIQEGLAGATAVAVSPDGKSVYATGVNDDAITRFDRDPATGALTPQGCFTDAGLGICGAAQQQGLRDASAVAVSPDNKSVYVAGRGSDNAIVRFDRDPASGALTAQGCITDVDTPAAGCGATAQGLAGANGIAISPDDKSVYVVSENDDAIVTFTRDTTGTIGALTPAGCISDAGGVCPNTQQGMDRVTAVAASQDGKSVYAVSRADSALVRFDRDLLAGSIIAQGCIADPTDGTAGCAATQEGLSDARAVAVSADNKSVYAASNVDAAVSRFDRDSNGALTAQGCIADVGATPGCAANQQGLAGAQGVAATADNASVYATGSADSAIASLDRNTTTGALTGQGCVAITGDPPGCGATGQALAFPLGVAISADSKSVYAAGFGRDAIIRFDRGEGSVPPDPVPPAPPVDPIPPDNDFKIGKPTKEGIRIYVWIATGDKGRINIREAPRRRVAVAAKAKKKKLLKPSHATAPDAGRVRVPLKLTKTAKTRLKDKGKLKVKAEITFTPDGGTPNTKTATLKIKD